jgi:hypothetical protein
LFKLTDQKRPEFFFSSQVQQVEKCAGFPEQTVLNKIALLLTLPPHKRISSSSEDVAALQCKDNRKPMGVLRLERRI